MPCLLAASMTSPGVLYPDFTCISISIVHGASPVATNAVKQPNDQTSAFAIFVAVGSFALRMPSRKAPFHGIVMLARAPTGAGVNAPSPSLGGAQLLSLPLTAGAAAPPSAEKRSGAM